MTSASITFLYNYLKILCVFWLKSCLKFDRLVHEKSWLTTNWICLWMLNKMVVLEIKIWNTRRRSLERYWTGLNVFTWIFTIRLSQKKWNNVFLQFKNVSAQCIHITYILWRLEIIWPLWRNLNILSNLKVSN